MSVTKKLLLKWYSWRIFFFRNILTFGSMGEWNQNILWSTTLWLRANNIVTIFLPYNAQRSEVKNRVIAAEEKSKCDHNFISSRVSVLFLFGLLFISVFTVVMACQTFCKHVYRKGDNFFPIKTLYVWLFCKKFLLWLKYRFVCLWLPKT